MLREPNSDIENVLCLSNKGIEIIQKNLILKGPKLDSTELHGYEVDGVTTEVRGIAPHLNMVRQGTLLSAIYPEKSIH